MRKNTTPCYYGDYLQLDKILSAQRPVSADYGAEAHDETLFIITHQAYELWFKQMLHELHSIIAVFSEETVADQQLTSIVHRLKRIIRIQEVINQQIGILETMTPQDFMDFRDYLVPASGFQSIQFKRLEILLGLRSEFRVDFDKESFYSRLAPKDQEFLQHLETLPSLFDLVEQWLERMPFLEFGDFKFWALYEQGIKTMLDRDREIVQTLTHISEKDRQAQLAEIERIHQQFQALLQAESFESLRENGEFRLSHRAMMGALFINLYREEPAFNLPFQVLSCLMDIEENLTMWRYRHVMMVQRMLGSKIGTGGSSGSDYLRKTTENNKIFTDLFKMSTFMLPHSELPELPDDVRKALGFYTG